MRTEMGFPSTVLLFVLFSNNYSDSESFKFLIVECILILYHIVTLGQLVTSQRGPGYQCQCTGSYHISLPHMTSHHTPSNLVAHGIISYNIEGCAGISWCPPKNGNNMQQ